MILPLDILEIKIPYFLHDLRKAKPFFDHLDQHGIFWWAPFVAWFVTFLLHLLHQKGQISILFNTLAQNSLIFVDEFFVVFFRNEFAFLFQYWHHPHVKLCVFLDPLYHIDQIVTHYLQFFIGFIIGFDILCIECLDKEFLVLFVYF